MWATARNVRADNLLSKQRLSCSAVPKSLGSGVREGGGGLLVALRCCFMGHVRASRRLPCPPMHSGLAQRRLIRHAEAVTMATTLGFGVAVTSRGRRHGALRPCWRHRAGDASIRGCDTRTRSSSWRRQVRRSRRRGRPLP
ncbi:hypothetical protein MHYP_G00074870 [Metynnis hypsauchen]